MMTIFYVGCGGFFGAISRYLLGLWLTPWVSGYFPWPTLLINLLGSFLIGSFYGSLQGRAQSDWFFFLIPGLLGGFTTFSAFSFEILSLYQKQELLLAVLYAVTSLIGGLLFCGLGFQLAR
jgi:fluoride exporter